MLKSDCEQEIACLKRIEHMVRLVFFVLCMLLGAVLAK
jgi:hypothetical protein